VILVGDCRELLAGLPERSVQTCVTSPPYFGLRDYGTGEWDGGDPDHEHHGTHGAGGGSSKNGAGRAGMGGREHVNGAPNRGGDPSRCPCGARRVDRQIGLEPTPDEFVAALVEVFREVRRVLRDDGTVWLNLGDSYAAVNRGENATPRGDAKYEPYMQGTHFHADLPTDRRRIEGQKRAGIKVKDLLGVPWMVAFALRADGWYLRSDIIWNKPNPMPESVTDRPTKSHEYVFLLSKGSRYFYDADAIREDGKDWSTGGPGVGIENTAERYGNGNGGNDGLSSLAGRYKAGKVTPGRNKRSVWTVATQPYAGAHFATFPARLIEPCILAGTSPKACGACGAPWRRVVEQAHAEPDLSQRSTAHYDTGERYGAGNGGNGGFDKLAAKMRAGEHGTRTVGWESSCAHEDDTGTCAVLDPFAGSGTTGVVCGWHGREFIGCELNPEYAAMAEARIALEGRPGGKPAHHEPVVIVAEQMGLL
jgi:DNA modification methylase